MTDPYIQDTDFTLYVGDVREVLATLEPGSVDCCVTSPPYWGLRDYGSDGQIGLEATPELFVAELVAVFREVRRVLADHGTLWLNLGDSYARSAGPEESKWATLETMSTGQRNVHANGGVPAKENRPPDGLKAKDLVGIPWRVAFALQADGWYLRSDIVWSKPNPMPESVTDRPTKAHEYVFLLTKSPRYFFDQEAVRENDGGKPSGNGFVRPHRLSYGDRGNDEQWEPGSGRNIRSVWEIATQPYPDAHFATFPEALPERCIKAGCPERVCVTCGKASERIVERQSGYSGARRHDSLDKRGLTQGTGWQNKSLLTTETVGWSDCGHDNWRPGVTLDPFMGSGTTALVARRLGRKSVGVELNPEYAELCARRLQQLSLLA